MPDISLCMIVRNEEQNIRWCLESAAPFVNEIIVVDTGSQDGTAEICRKFSARMFDYEWDGDFSAARNYGLKYASGDWILCLDADEELKVHDLPALENCLQKCKNDMISVQMTHFYGISPASAQRSHISSAFRLFRNGAGLLFSGKVHERLTPGISGTIPAIERNRAMRILHYGYMDDELKRKNNRNIELLVKEKAVMPDDPWLDYHLAAECCRLKEYEKAYGFISAAIVRFLEKNILPPSLVYKLKYDILVTTGNFALAYPGIEKAIKLYPDYVDLHFYKGLILLMTGEHEKAIRTFQYCLILGEVKPEYLVLSGSGSFLALYYMGLCYEKQQCQEQAVQAYLQAIRLSPDFELAVQRLEAMRHEASG